MKPFNLEKALAGEYCVTESGQKVKVIFDLRSLNVRNRRISFPLLGYIMDKDGEWTISQESWKEDGRFSPSINGSCLDIVGMWEERQPEVTIAIPAPLKAATDGQEVWYAEYMPERVCNRLVHRTHPTKHIFKNNDEELLHLLELGQLFRTKEDCQTFLKAIKGVRR